MGRIRGYHPHTDERDDGNTVILGLPGSPPERHHVQLSQQIPDTAAVFNATVVQNTGTGYVAGTFGWCATRDLNPEPADEERRLPRFGGEPDEPGGHTAESRDPRNDFRELLQRSADSALCGRAHYSCDIRAAIAGSQKVHRQPSAAFAVASAAHRAIAAKSPALSPRRGSTG